MNFTKLQDAINAQIVAEMWSANLYLSMSYFFAAKGYEGFGFMDESAGS